MWTCQKKNRYRLHIHNASWSLNAAACACSPRLEKCKAEGTLMKPLFVSIQVERIRVTFRNLRFCTIAPGAPKPRRVLFGECPKSPNPETGGSKPIDNSYFGPYSSSAVPTDFRRSSRGLRVLGLWLNFFLAYIANSLNFTFHFRFPFDSPFLYPKPQALNPRPKTLKFLRFKH